MNRNENIAKMQAKADAKAEEAAEKEQNKEAMEKKRQDKLNNLRNVRRALVDDATSGKIPDIFAKITVEKTDALRIYLGEEPVRGNKQEKLDQLRAVWGRHFPLSV